jgi:hypothetical protein
MKNPEGETPTWLAEALAAVAPQHNVADGHQGQGAGLGNVTKQRESHVVAGLQPSKGLGKGSTGDWSG